jgi:hypothetical protein
MYIRKGVNCETVPQPAHSTATDAYGNTFENWCTDYRGCDVDNSVVKTGCDPQDPDGLIPLWEHRDVDNVQRTLFAYVDSPLIPTALLQDVILNNPGDPLVLGLDQDRDLILFRENGQQYLQLEDSSAVSASASATT